MTEMMHNPKSDQGRGVMRRYWKAILIGYAAMAVFTFGHSASHNKKVDCEFVSGKITNQPCDLMADEDRVLGAFASAPFWPLYWSWVLQS